MAGMDHSRRRGTAGSKKNKRGKHIRIRTTSRNRQDIAMIPACFPETAEITQHIEQTGKFLFSDLRLSDTAAPQPS